MKLHHIRARTKLTVKSADNALTLSAAGAYSQTSLDHRNELFEFAPQGLGQLRVGIAEPHVERVPQRILNHSTQQFFLLARQRRVDHEIHLNGVQAMLDRLILPDRRDAAEGMKTYRGPMSRAVR